MGKVIQFKQAIKANDKAELLEEYYALEEEIKDLEANIKDTENYIETYKDKHTETEYKIYKLAIQNTIKILIKKIEIYNYLKNFI
jgi:uncharacterized protein YlxW (UPF0749 family)